LNDPSAHVDRKDKMAALAASYLHAKAGEKADKKEAR
jgi:NAD(P)H-hydrate repair Nnr-like enzyme with NAD(P)H-hydrate dehydratase domain